MKYSCHRLQTSTEKAIKDAENAIAEGVEVGKNKIELVNFKDKLQALSVGKINYQRNFRNLSTSLHPFSILSASRQSRQLANEKMHNSLLAIRQIKDKFEIPDAKNRLDRVERQIPDAAKQIDLWGGGLILQWKLLT